MDIDEEIKYYDKVLVLFDDSERSQRILDKFIEMIKMNQKNGLIIISEESSVCSPGLEIKSLDVEELRQFYQLYKFTDKIIWGSFLKPYGRFWERLIESGCMTENQIIEGLLEI